MRDFFLFACYTGLTFKDVFTLIWSGIKNPGSSSGTGTGLKKVFPIKSNQKNNEYLKEIDDEMSGLVVQALNLFNKKLTKCKLFRIEQDNPTKIEDNKDGF